MFSSLNSVLRNARNAARPYLFDRRTSNESAHLVTSSGDNFRYLADLSGPGGKNSEKSLHESDLLDKHPSLVFMVLDLSRVLSRRVCCFPLNTDVL